MGYIKTKRFEFGRIIISSCLFHPYVTKLFRIGDVIIGWKKKIPYELKVLLQDLNDNIKTFYESYQNKDISKEECLYEIYDVLATANAEFEELLNCYGNN